MTEQHEHPLNHRGQLLGFGSFVAVWAMDSFVVGWSTPLASFIPLWARITLSAAILALAIYMFSAVLTLFGSNSDSDELITVGVFARIRHPMYASITLVYLGLAISTGSLMSLLVALLIFRFYDRMAAYEEDYLLKRDDTRYADYMMTTGRWFPR